MKRVLGAFLLAAFGSVAAAQDAVTPPDEVVREATTTLQNLIRKNHEVYRQDQAAFYKVVDEIVVPHFDVPFIARSILARHWRSADEAQRARFQIAFKNMLIRSYANALLEYHESVRAEWRPLRMPDGANDVTVYSDLMRDGKPPVAISFAMHIADGAWRIYDISVENISLITNFRGQVNAEVKKTGLAALIDRMEAGQALGAPKSESQSAANAAQTAATK